MINRGYLSCDYCGLSATNENSIAVDFELQHSIHTKCLILMQDEKNILAMMKVLKPLAIDHNLESKAPLRRRFHWLRTQLNEDTVKYLGEALVLPK
jgi:hypothetical protein